MCRIGHDAAGAVRGDEREHETIVIVTELIQQQFLQRSTTRERTQHVDDPRVRVRVVRDGVYTRTLSTDDRAWDARRMRHRSRDAVGMRTVSDALFSCRLPPVHSYPRFRSGRGRHPPDWVGEVMDARL